jgi:hypothetical protein
MATHHFHADLCIHRQHGEIITVDCDLVANGIGVNQWQNQ